MAETVALIPARGGSKGILRKNLQTVGGVPLVVRSIRDALRSRAIAQVFVSTDDAQIASVARQAGAEVISRPGTLAGDKSSTEAVVEHAMSHWDGLGIDPDAIVLLQCTSPFRTPGQLDNALAQFRQSGCDSMLSVVREHAFFWEHSDHGRGISALNYDPAARPMRQDAKRLYRETGSFYIFTADAFRSTKVRLSGYIEHYEVPPGDALEIDEPFQLMQARREWELRGESLELFAPERIKWLVLDVDGTLTDGTMTYSDDGVESKRFYTRDGHGIARWRERGGKVAWITGESNPLVEARARKLGVEFLALGCRDKRIAMAELRARFGLGKGTIVAMGDDVLDLPLAESADYFVVPADGEPEVMACADWTTRRKGGQGAVRELIDSLLRQGACAPYQASDEDSSSEDVAA